MRVPARISSYPLSRALRGGEGGGGPSAARGLRISIASSSREREIGVQLQHRPSLRSRPHPTLPRLLRSREREYDATAA
jgi:hypothetical protein